MWKKTDQEPPQNDYTPTTTPSANPLKERATIGASILIQGDLKGEEDLLIQGRVEGRIELKKYNLTVGDKGRVKADINARIISVEGEVEGNLFAEEKIIVRKSGKVKGNLVAPRVGLEDGSTFKGSIDMDSSSRSGGGDKPAGGVEKSESRVQGSSAPQKAPLTLTDPLPSRGQ